MLTRTFNYKFLRDDTVVHVVSKHGKPTHHLLRNTELFSEVYSRKEHGEPRNVVVGYINDNLLKDKMRCLTKTTPNVSTLEMPLRELKDHCDTLRMPLLVYVNSYCALHEHDNEYYEVFFYNYQTNDDTYIKNLFHNNKNNQL